MMKKGFLLAETTVKIIIAVICIGFLVYLLYSLYAGGVRDKKLEQAEASLDFLVGEIDSGSLVVEVYNPKGWYLTSWPFKGKKPLTCDNMGWKSCVCICNGLNIFENAAGTLGFVSPSDELMNECDTSGICREAEAIVLNQGMQAPIKIKSPLELKIDYSKGVAITK